MKTVGPPTLTPTLAGSPRGQSPGPAGHRANTVCPVKVEALLGIGDREDVAVVDGVIIRLERTGPRRARQKGEPASAQRAVQATLELHLAALRQWALTHRSNWRYTSLDRNGPRPQEGASPQIARFVQEKVIPLLQRRDGPADKPKLRSERQSRGFRRIRCLRELTRPLP